MSGEEEDGNFERPPITEDLRQILEKYPPGGQILKVRLRLKSVTHQIIFRKQYKMEKMLELPKSLSFLMKENMERIQYSTQRKEKTILRTCR